MQRSTSSRHHRRMFITSAATGIATACFGLRAGATALATQIPERSEYVATGRRMAVASSSRQSTEAAMSILNQGGNAADAYIAAAVTQTVVEPGLTSLAGAFSINFFNASTQEVKLVAARLGPAALEPYDYDRDDGINRTGRAMPVPGFVAGIHAAHREFGVATWKGLFDPAIRHAREGFAVPQFIVAAAMRNGVHTPEGKALWTLDGRLLNGGEKLVQTELGKLLNDIAENDPSAFYEGEFRADTSNGRSKIVAN